MFFLQDGIKQGIYAFNTRRILSEPVQSPMYSEESCSGGAGVRL